MIALLGFIVLALFGSQIIWSFLKQERYQQALEGAALKAASDLSEIVINDPYFGFISLSDRPAIGEATLAADGQPLPVHSINSIIAAARLDYLVALELGDARLEELALEDSWHAKEAENRLERALELSLKPDNKSDARDMDNKVVRPYADALKVYTEGLKCFTKASPKEFNLTLGWLRKSGATVTPVPQPGNSHYVPDGAVAKGCYRPFMDIPVRNEHYSFTGVGSQTSLVSADQFVPQDGVQISSIVRADATGETSSFLPWEKTAHGFIGAACAQPYALNRQPAPSVLVVAFPDGRPDGINSLRDLLSNTGLNGAIMRTYTPVKGDFPIDPGSQLQPSGSDRVSAGAAFATGFHDWLRSNYALPKIDSVLAACNQGFPSTSESSNSMSFVFVVEITCDGNAVVSSLHLNPFADLRIAESQWYAINDTPAQIGASNWTVVCRDQVRTLGTIQGGKHAGQPYPGDPINWAELNSYVNEAFAAAAATRRPGGLVLLGEEAPGGGIALTGAQLQKESGGNLSRNMRTSNYSPGLASEIRISSPMAAQ
jgi:hypothetical protein